MTPRLRNLAVIGTVFLTVIAFYFKGLLASDTAEKPDQSTIERQLVIDKSNVQKPIQAIDIKDADRPITDLESNKKEEHLIVEIKQSSDTESTNKSEAVNTNTPDEQLALPPTPEQYDTEEIDAYWAFDKENYYINLFSETESLAGFVLSAAECKSRQCKLSFLLANEEQKDDITNKLMEKLMSQSQDLRVSFDLSSPRDKAVLYIEDAND